MPPTLARRYIYKLFSNMASIPVYLLMEAILPRALGPAAYGNFNFATSLFQQLSGFLDMGTSTCFYNSLSREQQNTALFAFYCRIAICIGLLIIIISAVLLWRPIGNLVLPDTPLWIAPFAAIWAFLTWAGRILRSVNDALGQTIPSELWRTGVSIGGILLLGGLYLAGTLNLKTLFFQQYFLLGLTAFTFWHVSSHFWRSQSIQINFRLAKSQLRRFTRDYFNYSHPLFVQALLSFIMLASERWLLQWFDGSGQQGFFSLSQKVSMACFLFVSAMTPLLMREFSIAWGKQDLQGMGALLARFAPILYAVAAYFSCFTLVEGRTLVEFFGGSEFAPAILPVQIMALYPLHQAYGQMASSVFHASGKTYILRNMTACECVYGLGLAWFLIAPPDLFGLNLGATGLAIKTVVSQFVTVNIYLWLASRLIPFRFWRNLLHQLLCVLIFFLAALAARLLSEILIIPAGLYYLRFFLSGIIYTFSIILLCLAFPQLTGLSRRDLAEILIRARKALPAKHTGSGK